MKQTLLIIALAFATALPFAAQSPAPAAQDRIIAKVNGHPITLEQFERPLIESYGLSLLLNMVQLEAVKQEAGKIGAKVTPAEIEHERDVTLDKMFKDATKADYPNLLDQFLLQQRISRSEFDIVMETNAYLRKLAEPLLKGKITDDNLQEAFRAIYGETILVRDIRLSNLQEIAEAKRRLAGGDSFEKVAREMSRDPLTAPIGGEMPPFSRQMTGVAEAFKEAAFALKVGEVSDAVQSNGAYHLIKLEKRNAPKAVKFEDVKDSVRAELNERWTQATMKELRAQIAQSALQGLDITDPTLKKQYDEKLKKRDAEIRDRQQIEKEMEKDRERLRKQQEFPGASTTGPGAAPLKPLPKKADAEPPAPKPGP